MQSTLKTTFSSCKVLANSSNSPLPAIPNQSTNHIADSTEPVEVLAYRHAICLVIGGSNYFPSISLIYIERYFSGYSTCTPCVPFSNKNHFLDGAIIESKYAFATDVSVKWSLSPCNI